MWPISPQRIFSKSRYVFGGQNGGIALVFVGRDQQSCAVGHALIPEIAPTISQSADPKCQTS